MRAHDEPEFLSRDRELDRLQFGPTWLANPAVAQMVVDALIYGDAARKMYRLHAFVIMPNHVHVVWTPSEDLSKIMEWLKGTTARRANPMIGINGKPFWQDEWFDHWIRDGKEFEGIVAYVENNPVSAGLVKTPEDWAWSSASVLPAGSRQDRLPHG
jgi:REP element-mobilizing transposase RayT